MDEGIMIVIIGVLLTLVIVGIVMLPPASPQFNEAAFVKLYGRKGGQTIYGGITDGNITLISNRNNSNYIVLGYDDNSKTQINGTINIGNRKPEHEISTLLRVQRGNTPNWAMYDRHDAGMFFTRGTDSDLQGNTRGIRAIWASAEISNTEDDNGEKGWHCMGLNSFSYFTGKADLNRDFFIGGLPVMVGGRYGARILNYSNGNLQSVAGISSLILQGKLSTTNIEWAMNFLAENGWHAGKSIENRVGLFVMNARKGGNIKLKNQYGIYIQNLDAGDENNIAIYIAGNNPITLVDANIRRSASQQLTIGASLIPDTNKAYDLGSGASVWKNVYAQNFIDTTKFPTKERKSRIKDLIMKIKGNKKGELEHSSLPSEIQRIIRIKKGKEKTETKCEKVYDYDEEKIVNRCKNVKFVEEIMQIWNGKEWKEVRSWVRAEDFKGEQTFVGRSLSDMVSYNTAAIQDIYNKLDELCKIPIISKKLSWCS